jgi:ketosteroid isomerase-like protein
MQAATEVPDWVADLYTLVDAAQIDAYLDRYYADDATVRFASTPVARGKAAIRVGLGHGHDAHDMEHTIVGVFEDGDTTVIEFDVTYGFRDGTSLDTHSLAVARRNDDGLIEEMRIYVDHGPVVARIEAAAAAGA